VDAFEGIVATAIIKSMFCCGHLQQITELKFFM